MWAQILAVPISPSSSIPIVYQLADIAIVGSEEDGFTATADLIFDADGGRRKFQSTGVGGTTTDANPPWSSLHPAETATWHVRLASHDTGINRYVGAPTLGTWTEITGAGQPTFDYAYIDTGPSGLDESRYTLELSDDGGSTVHDSMTLIVQLSISSP